MRRSKAALFPILLLAATAMFVLLPNLRAQQPADLVLHNGKILTVDANFSTAEAVAIRGQQFAAVGRNEEVLRLAGPGTRVIDLKGRTVIPGLIDTHAHIHNYTASAYMGHWGPEKSKSYAVDLRGIRSKDDLLNQIRGSMEKYSVRPGEWLDFSTGVYFTAGGSADEAKILYDDMNRWELDKVAPNNPMVLSLGIPDFNGFLLNSRAIEIIWNEMGYADFIKKYGRYWVDSAGRATGHVEPPASRILMKVLPQPDPEDLAPPYKNYLGELAATGVTTVSTRLPESSVAAYKLIESRGELTVRMGYGMEWVFGPLLDLEQGMKEFRNIAGTGDDKIWVTSVAPSAVDGASTRGCTNQKRQVAFGSIDRWWPTGQCHTDSEFRGAAGKGAPIAGNYFRDWTLQSGLNRVRFANTHVMGDRSVETLLGLMEQIQKQAGPEATKDWAFDHCTMVNPADLPRAARLGVTFSCAPKYIEDVAPNAAKSYGEKVAHTFIVPVKSIVDAGAKLVFEADRDVYTWYDLELLLTRKDRQGNVWGPQERLDKATTLKTITRWAADYVLKGDKLGSIEPGKLADLAVLDRDYMTIPSEEVSEIRPQLTILDGKIIYVNPQFAQEYNLRPAGALVATYEELLARRTTQRRFGFAEGDMTDRPRR